MHLLKKKKHEEYTEAKPLKKRKIENIISTAVPPPPSFGGPTKATTENARTEDVFIFCFTYRYCPIPIP